MSTWNLYRPGVAAIRGAGTDPVPEPGTPPPKPVDPPQTAPPLGIDQAKKWYDRTMKTRNFLAANPDRRPARMGFTNRGPAYDRSQWSQEQIDRMGQATVPVTSASRAAPITKPAGAFNGADPSLTGG